MLRFHRGRRPAECRPLVGGRIGRLRFSVTGVGVPGVRAFDYSFRAGYSFGPRADELGYQPINNGRFATRYTSARLGVRRDGLDVSVFVNNLFNSDDRLFQLQNTDTSPLLRETSFRPRTIGLTGYSLLTGNDSHVSPGHR